MGILEYIASSALYFINLHEMTSHLQVQATLKEIKWCFSSTIAHA